MEIDMQLAQLLGTMSLDSQRKPAFVSPNLVGLLQETAILTYPSVHGERQAKSSRRQREHVPSTTQPCQTPRPPTARIRTIRYAPVLRIPRFHRTNHNYTTSAKHRQLLKLQLQRHCARRGSSISFHLRMRVSAGHPRPDPLRGVQHHQRRLPRDHLHAS